MALFFYKVTGFLWLKCKNLEIACFTKLQNEVWIVGKSLCNKERGMSILKNFYAVIKHDDDMYYLVLWAGYELDDDWISNLFLNKNSYTYFCILKDHTGKAYWLLNKSQKKNNKSKIPRQNWNKYIGTAINICKCRHNKRFISSYFFYRKFYNIDV